jgi:hypothetical protein
MKASCSVKKKTNLYAPVSGPGASVNPIAGASESFDAPLHEENQGKKIKRQS